MKSAKNHVWPVDTWLPQSTFFVEIKIGKQRFPIYSESSFFNGMNRGRVVTAASGYPQILQGLPLSSNGIEERRADGRGGSPVENSDAVRHQRRGKEQDEEAKKLRRGFLVKMNLMKDVKIYHFRISFCCAFIENICFHQSFHNIISSIH